MKKIIICLFLSAGLSGCHVYRTYERPDMTVIDSLYRQPVVAADTASIASLSWKELFTDPQLQQLIETGIANNTDLNIARLKVKEAEALLLSSKLAYLPSVSLTPQGTLSSVDGSKTSKTYDLAASADWELDIFGKLTNAKRGATLRRRSTRSVPGASSLKRKRASCSSTTSPVRSRMRIFSR